MVRRLSIVYTLSPQPKRKKKIYWLLLQIPFFSFVACQLRIKRSFRERKLISRRRRKKKKKWQSGYLSLCFCLTFLIFFGVYFLLKSSVYTHALMGLPDNGALYAFLLFCGASGFSTLWRSFFFVRLPTVFNFPFGCWENKRKNSTFFLPLWF